jgi:predicted enzyme related to lactoylglutathione lyase
MGQPVVHFEVVGKDGAKLQQYYSELFGWEIDANNPMNYGDGHA